MKWLSLVFLSLFLVVGCTPVNPGTDGSTTDSGVQDSHQNHEHSSQESDRPKADYGLTQKTGDGNYTVSYSLVDHQMKEGELPLNKHFSVKVTVQDKDGKDVSDKVEIVADAAMLSHGHGMNVEPTYELKDKAFLIKGMLCHMPGKWTFYVHVRTKGTRPPSLKTYGEYYKYCEKSKKDCAVFHAYLP